MVLVQSLLSLCTVTCHSFNLLSVTSLALVTLTVLGPWSGGGIFVVVVDWRLHYHNTSIALAVSSPYF